MRTPKQAINLHSVLDADKRIAERLDEIAARYPSRAALFRAVYYGPLSKVAALKAKCLDCSCWQTEEIKRCPAVTCPLWRVRPYQDGPPCQTQGRGKRFSERKAAGRVKTAEAV